MRYLPWIVAVGMLPGIQADDWPTPVIREVFSPSRAYFVRVIPGKSFGDTMGFKGAAKGPYATAEFYRVDKDRSYRFAATTSLLNPVAPVDFLVTDDGFLMTLDNWHNMGYGRVVALYAPDGKLVRAYGLAELFTKGEIADFSHSESSIAWRKATGFYLRPGGKTIHITVNDQGAGFVFETSGAYQYCETREGTFQCRAASEGRTWSPFREPDPRFR